MMMKAKTRCLISDDSINTRKRVASLVRVSEGEEEKSANGGQILCVAVIKSITEISSQGLG